MSAYPRKVSPTILAFSRSARFSAVPYRAQRLRKQRMYPPSDRKEYRKGQQDGLRSIREQDRGSHSQQGGFGDDHGSGAQNAGGKTPG